jgi:hypothetical protein
MATIRVLIWHPGNHFTVVAPSEREAARLAEGMLRGLDAARRGTVAFWVEARGGGERRRLIFYLRDLARELEAESRLYVLTPPNEPATPRGGGGGR